MQRLYKAVSDFRNVHPHNRLRNNPVHRKMPGLPKGLSEENATTQPRAKKSERNNI
nr:MAG TPA: hypothetical protein [Caudoviricetes sp.]